MAAPRAGHLTEVFHMFAYIRAHDRSTMVFDPTEPEIDSTVFHLSDWSEYYPGAKEPVPDIFPEPLGQPAVTTCFVDADHAGCLETRRSHTGVLLFVNRAPISWFSKRQSTVEASTFGSEFIAMRIGIEMIEALRYKLRMFGVPIAGPTYVYCDNASVVGSATRSEASLKKKHVSIAYHRTREAQAAGHIRIGQVPSKENLADLFTKLVNGPRLKELLSHILW